MASPSAALGFAASLPALVLGATMLAAALHAPRAEALRTALPGALLVGGAALALGALLKARRSGVYLGAAAVAAGSVPLLGSGIGLVPLLSAGFLATLARPPASERALRAAARAVTAAALLFVAILAWRARAQGASPTLLDALLWAVLLALFAYAWWPARPQRGLDA